MVAVVGMTAWSWPLFGELCHICGGDVDCGRRFLWTPVVNLPCQGDMISHLYLQGDFDGCQHQADCDLYLHQYSHNHHFRGLHLFNWFLRGHGEVHLHPFQFPRHILSLLVARRCLFGLRVGMLSGHSAPHQK